MTEVYSGYSELSSQQGRNLRTHPCWAWIIEFQQNPPKSSERPLPLISDLPYYWIKFPTYNIWPPWPTCSKNWVSWELSNPCVYLVIYTFPFPHSACCNKLPAAFCYTWNWAQFYPNVSISLLQWFLNKSAFRFWILPGLTASHKLSPVFFERQK